MRAGKRKNIYKLWIMVLFLGMSMICAGKVRAEDGSVLQEGTEAAEAVQTEAPQTETPTTETPITEAPSTEAPQTQAPQSEGTKESQGLDAKKIASLIYTKISGKYLSNKAAAALQKKHALQKNQGKILLAGGSTIRRWTTAAAQFAPLATLNMGIGGSTTRDWLSWYQQLIVDYHPQAVVLYVGGNDFNGSTVKGKTVAKRCQQLLKKLVQELPDTPIYYVGVYPSLFRKKDQKQINIYNRQMKKYCRQYTNLHYIDISSAFYKKGKLQLDLLVSDGLHLSSKGYHLWNKAVVKQVKAGIKKS